MTDMSDHLPCIAVFPSANKHNEYIYQKYRLITDTNKAKFRQQLIEKSDALSFHCSNPHTNLQDKHNDFFDHFTRLYNESFPIKHKKIHIKTLQKPWITKEIQIKIEKRNSLFSQK